MQEFGLLNMALPGCARQTIGISIHPGSRTIRKLGQISSFGGVVGRSRLGGSVRVIFPKAVSGQCPDC